jgi:catechol 2,3-dioxygenase-like lactoylglutathione lyase family enzyme
MTENRKPRLVGINHVALEVGDVAAALDFYGAIFTFTLRSSHRDDDGGLAMAFIEMGDQFLALSRGRRQGPDEQRHFGLVVDDRARVLELGATMVEGPFRDFLDPWGNRIEVVAYGDVQFSKTPAVLRSIDLTLEKSDGAKAELRDKGMA